MLAALNSIGLMGWMLELDADWRSLATPGRHTHGLRSSAHAARRHATLISASCPTCRRHAFTTSPGDCLSEMPEGREAPGCEAAPACAVLSGWTVWMNARSPKKKQLSGRSRLQSSITKKVNMSVQSRWPGQPKVNSQRKMMTITYSMSFGCEDHQSSRMKRNGPTSLTRRNTGLNMRHRI